MSARIPPITKISPVVIRILGMNPGSMTLQGTNTYLIGNGPKRILFDTGDRGKPEYIKHLKNILSSEDAILEHIIISHWHQDHIGGLKEVIRSVAPTDCKVWKYRRTDCQEPDVISGIRIHDLENNQEFSTEGATIRVMHTPGHTTDHICLALQEEFAIFSGDCILGEGSTIFENLFDYMGSLEKIRNLNASVIYPGHGPVVEAAERKIKEYIDHRLNRESEIISILSNSPFDKLWTVDEIAQKLYAQVSESLLMAAVYNVKHHLEKLQIDGKVVEENHKWKIKRSNL